MKRYLALLLLAPALSGCGVHGLTGIYNNISKTNQQLQHISQQLDRLAAKR